MKRTVGKRAALLAGLGFALLAVTTGVLCSREIHSWYVLWTFFERLPANAQGCAEYRHRQTGIVFVRLTGGKFSMGREGSEYDRISSGLQPAMSRHAGRRAPSPPSKRGEHSSGPPQRGAGGRELLEGFGAVAVGGHAQGPGEGVKIQSMP